MDFLYDWGIPAALVLAAALGYAYFRWEGRAIDQARASRSPAE